MKPADAMYECLARIQGQTGAMKLLSLVIVVLAMALISPAHAQDSRSAFDAYERGDYDTALQEFRALANRGNVLASHKLGLMYNNGEGVRQNFREAIIWFRQAAAYGHAPAQTMLGIKYEKGQGVGRKFDEAAKWYRHGAEQGDATAQYRLGRLYVLGRGVPRDYTQAVAWFELAAAQGFADAAAARDSVAAHLSRQQLAEAKLKVLQLTQN